jgi:hypothetical protein
MASRSAEATRAVALVVATVFGSVGAAFAAAPGGIVGHEAPARLSATEVNKRVTDPVSTTWSIKLENDLELLDIDGHGSEVQNTLKLQPTMPVILGERFKLIARPQLTLVDDKPYANSAGALRRTTGFGDTILDLVLSPRGTPWRLALGPTFVFPTASLDQTGQGKWQIGPAGVLGYHTEAWLAGLIGQQWFSYAGDADRKDVSELHLQYIAYWFFGDGWSIGTDPILKVNWNADPGQQVTFPLGPSIGKVIKLGDVLPVKLELDLFYAPVHPDDGEQAAFQFKVTPVIPSPLP